LTVKVKIDAADTAETVAVHLILIALAAIKVKVARSPTQASAVKVAILTVVETTLDALKVVQDIRIMVLAKKANKAAVIFNIS
jgi:hypothetical protein